MHALLFCWSLCALGFLCLGARRYRHQLGRQAEIARRWHFKVWGWVLLCVAVLLCGMEHRWGIRLVQLCGTLSMAAVLVVLLLTYRTRWLMPVVLLNLALGLGLSVLFLVSA